MVLTIATVSSLHTRYDLLLDRFFSFFFFVIFAHPSLLHLNITCRILVVDHTCARSILSATAAGQMSLEVVPAQGYSFEFQFPCLILCKCFCTTQDKLAKLPSLRWHTLTCSKFFDPLLRQRFWTIGQGGLTGWDGSVDCCIEVSLVILISYYHCSSQMQDSTFSTRIDERFLQVLSFFV